MKEKPKIVISASRRTDIPAFYMPWFMKCIERGIFEVVNPFNRHVKIVPATTANVHTIVFWSKDFGHFLKHNCGQKLRKAGYHLSFNFTVNSKSSLLEPRVPVLEKRLDQLKQLSEQFGPQAINWRFDPICFFKTTDGRVENNLRDLGRIVMKAAEVGIKRCITSFMDPYRKSVDISVYHQHPCYHNCLFCYANPVAK